MTGKSIHKHPNPSSLIDLLEAAAFKAWPAFEQSMVDGWLVRFAGGYTKRSNSANFVESTECNSISLISQCEELFKAHGLPPIFRIVARPETVTVDQALEQRGYQQRDPSIVMTCPLERYVFRPRTSESFSSLALSDWFPIFCELQQVSESSQAIHRQLLDRITPLHKLAIITEAGQPVACGIAVVDSDVCGFFDIVTHSGMRRKGHGANLMSGLAEWGREQNATLFYLQVVRSNVAARELYRKLNFQDAYTYWYRTLNGTA